MSAFLEEHNNRSREDRKMHHMPSAKIEDISRVHQLSQSPSNLTLDVSPSSVSGIQHNSRSLNPASSLSKKSLAPAPPINKQSPNFKRIVNIYSVNSYKKKKGPSNNAGSNPNHSALLPQNPNIYRADEIKQKLRNIYEQDRSHSIEPASHHSHQFQLPELKSVTPQVSNVKHHYAPGNAGSNIGYSAVGPSNMIKLIGRKKSYERLMRLDQQLYGLYGKNSNSNGQMLSNPTRGVNSYSLKQK